MRSACFGRVAALSMVFASLVGCKDKPPPAKTVAPAVVIDDRPAEQPSRIELGDLKPGLYKVSRAWRSDSCDKAQLEVEKASKHKFFSAMESQTMGVMVALQRCAHEKEKCQDMAAAAIRGESHPDFTLDGLFQLILLEKDVTGRLFGSSYGSGTVVDGVCEGAFGQKGWVEAHGDSHRLVVRERRGDYPAPEKGYCQTGLAEKHLEGQACTLLVFDLKHVAPPPDVPCADRTDCRHKGLCTAKGDACVAATAEDCKDQCKMSGACRPIDGVCSVGGDEDCKRSDPCASQGLCFAIDSSTALGRADCRAKSDDDCIKSTGCKDQGDCAVTPEGLCRPKSDADCAKSALCKEKGFCKKGYDKTNPRYACIK